MSKNKKEEMKIRVKLNGHDIGEVDLFQLIILGAMIAEKKGEKQLDKYLAGIKRIALNK